MRTTKHREDGRDWDETEDVAQNSVEVSQNAKGFWQATIKVYWEPGMALGAVAEVAELRDMLAAKFRLAEPAEPPVVLVKGEKV